MGYALYDANGFVDVLGSAYAWWTIIHEVDKHTSNGALYDFVQTGKTRDPDSVITDIVKLLPSISDTEIRDSFITLQDKLKKCSEVAIVDD